MKEAASNDVETEIAERIAVSIKQPWATLIVHGLKTIELRNWRPLHRGTLFIHAGANPDETEAAWANVPEDLKHFAYRRRGIVGKVELTEVKQYDALDDYQADRAKHLASDEWFSKGMFGWVFENPERLPFEPRPGNQRLFRL
jgi:hypothetical protein